MINGNDPRVAYGAGCTWWDSIDKVAKRSSGLPCCPYCSGMLFEMPNEKQWWQQVDKHAETEPGYHEFIEWLRGRCLPSFAIAKHDWEVAR